MTIETLDTRFTASTTDKYATIKTSDIITKLEGRGFKLVDFQAKRLSKKKRAEGRAGYQAHVVTMELRDNTLANDVLARVGTPRIVFTNSHDGTKSLQFHVGFIRFACSNGLIVGKQISESLRIVHKGDKANIDEKVEEVIQWAAKAIDKLVTSYTKMTQTVLTSAQILEFRQKAAKLRGLDDINIDAKRDADVGDDLFTVYNRIQESLVRGGNKAVRDGNPTSRNVVAIRSPLVAIDVNTRLADLAAQYLGA